MTSTGPKAFELDWEWLGRIDYTTAETLQRSYAKERALGQRNDTLLLLEHPHVITLGRSAQEKDILVSTSQLEAHQVKKQRCDRGGQVTYHGPGQLVGYLIVNLYELKLSVPRFVCLVEEALSTWFQSIGIDVERCCDRPGLWYQGAKIASLGFHISRGITRHGFAINIAPDLRYFDWIIPCGTKMRTTSVANTLSRTIDLSVAAAAVADYLCQTFSSSTDVSSSSALSSDVPADALDAVSADAESLSSS